MIILLKTSYSNTETKLDDLRDLMCTAYSYEAYSCQLVTVQRATYLNLSDLLIDIVHQLQNPELIKGSLFSFDSHRKIPVFDS